MAAAEQPPTTPGRVPRPASTIVVIVEGPIARADVPGLCDRVRALLAGGTGPVVCDVGAIVNPDAVTVDALARVQLTTLRAGRRVRLRHACDELRELLALMGLCDVLPLCASSPVEPSGQAEEREQARGVEEEADPHDPAG